MAKGKAATIANTDFPLYVILMVGDRHFLVAGGGGQAKTGIPNAFEIFELKAGSGNGCVADKVFRYETGQQAIMNGTITSMTDKKDYTLAVGVDDSCKVYRLKYKVVVPKNEEQVSEGVRKRKGNLTQSEDHKSSKRVVSFEVEEGESVQTDFHKKGGFQKAVTFTKDHSLMVTGGADGYLRVWQFPQLKKLYQVKAHTDDIDDLDISPKGSKIVTASRDNKACIWNTRDGKKQTDLVWNKKTDIQYRIRNCRFGIVVDKEDQYNLYTSHIPCTRGKKLSCFITKWDTTSFKPSRTVSTGEEILSAMAVSDEGIYLGVGTISGSVAVYISFSLQKLYHVEEAHNIFVTGMEFTPSGSNTRVVTGSSEFTLLSISADNQVKVHQVKPRSLYSPLWAVLGMIILIYLFFWFISNYGL